jgi:hypothetical protein
MTQPSFAPVPEADTVRPAYRLRTPSDWRANRVADLRGSNPPQGGAFGSPGPDQGYALKLGHELFQKLLILTSGERADDAIHGCAMVASARAALFGRAPVAPDLEMALTLFGFLGGAPEELVTWRAPRFSAIGHHYTEQRRVVACVPETTLRMNAEQVRQKLPDWKDFLDTSAA